MKPFVYTLLDVTNVQLVTVAYSIHGAATIAAIEYPELVLDDGSPMTLEALETRLSHHGFADLYGTEDARPVGRLERHLVLP